VNFGIVGTGLIAEFHAKALAEIEGARLVACLDKLPDRAAAFGAKHGCAVYADLRDFLAHPGLEVVNVCTPSGLHLETALPSAAAGKHLVVEKPLETTSERCRRMIEACERHGVLLSGIFPSRFYGAARAVKAAVDAGRFGKLTLGGAHVRWWREQSYYAQGGWKGTKALDGGGALMNQSIHAIDLLLWFMGEAREVLAYAGEVGHEGIEVEDNAVAAVSFRNGALGVVQGSTAAWPGFAKRVEVSGLSGSAVLEEENLVFWKFRDESADDDAMRETYSRRVSRAGAASDPAAIGHLGHRLQLEDVVRAVEGGGRPLVDGVEASKAVTLIEAIYKSSETGAPAEVAPL
jgi:UDP-N-acetyl-2-amino-2-deoxyglucuronate dehydrogenase